MSSYKPILPHRPKVAASILEGDGKGNANNINVNGHSLPERKRAMMVTTDTVVANKMDAPIIRKLVKEPSQDIDQIAEAFIQRFRKQLQLQRIKSIENYEQMLKRGT